MTINICVLGSSSSGNSTLVWTDNSVILVDAGCRWRYTEKCLEELGISPEQIDGVLITHSHGDHVYGPTVRNLLIKEVPFFFHSEMEEVLFRKCRWFAKKQNASLVRTYDTSSFDIGEFTIYGFPVDHDAEGGCFGYTLSVDAGSDEKKLSIATDMGKPDNDTLSRFINSDGIIIESNFDTTMELMSGRHPDLIERNLEVHMSNVECASFLERVWDGSVHTPSAVILAHISQECNTNEKALNTVSDMLKKIGHDETKVHVTYPAQMTDVITI